MHYHSLAAITRMRLNLNLLLLDQYLLEPTASLATILRLVEQASTTTIHEINSPLNPTNV
jgi:hypothetical protein